MTEDSLSNARLIAAAPELLEACKEAQSFLEKSKSVKHDDESYVVYSAISEAIAKTEGR